MSKMTESLYSHGNDGEKSRKEKRRVVRGSLKTGRRGDELRQSVPGTSSSNKRCLVTDGRNVNAMYNQ